MVLGPAPPLRGGIAAHTRGLHRALTDRGWDCEVFSYSRLYPHRLFPGRRQTHGNVELGAALLDTMRPGSWRSTADSLIAFSPEVCLVQWWHPAVAPALVSILNRTQQEIGPVPFVVVCHNLVPHERFPASRMLTSWVLSKATGVLCHSCSVAGQVAERFPSVAVKSSPMPILLDSSSFPGTRARRDARRNLGLQDGQPTALFLGHARPYKGLDLLVRAWADARLPSDARLLIAGESYLGRGRVGRMLASHPKAGSIQVEDRYLGDGELGSFLAAADVLVAPYRSASQSGVIPMAVAAGLRVIASDAGGLAEALPGGRRHAVVRAGDSGSLALVLEDYLGTGYLPAAGADPLGQERDKSADTVKKSWLEVVEALNTLLGLIEGG